MRGRERARIWEAGGRVGRNFSQMGATSATTDGRTAPDGCRAKGGGRGEWGQAKRLAARAGPGRATGQGGGPSPHQGYSDRDQDGRTQGEGEDLGKGSRGRHSRSFLGSLSMQTESRRTGHVSRYSGRCGGVALLRTGPGALGEPGCGTGQDLDCGRLWGAASP